MNEADKKYNAKSIVNEDLSDEVEIEFNEESVDHYITNDKGEEIGVCLKENGEKVEYLYVDSVSDKVIEKEIVEDADNTPSSNSSKKTSNRKESARKIEYEGTLYKCPNCGEQIESFETACKTCGYELRNVQNTSVVHDLAIKLETIDDVEKINETIRNFYIPNTKEDICEFIILATTNMNADGQDSRAWKAKLEQAYQKAKLSFGNTPQFDDIEKLYKKANKVYLPHSFISSVKNSKNIQGLLLIVAGAIMLVLGGSFAFSNLGFSFLSFVGMILLIVGINRLDSQKNLNKKKKQKNQYYEKDDDE